MSRDSPGTAPVTLVYRDTLPRGGGGMDGSPGSPGTATVNSGSTGTGQPSIHLPPVAGYPCTPEVDWGSPGTSPGTAIVTLV